MAVVFTKFVTLPVFVIATDEVFELAVLFEFVDPEPVLELVETTFNPPPLPAATIAEPVVVNEVPPVLADVLVTLPLGIVLLAFIAY